MADWVSIKAEYIATSISMRDLAEKHGVSFSSLGKKATKERWKDERTKTENKVATRVKQKIVAVSVSKEVDRLTRLLSISDKLAAKLEQATEELDRQLVRNKKKTRVITYGDQAAKGKPTKEVIDELETLDTMKAPIDRLGLQQLSSALKNLRDVANTPRADEQSLEKIRELMAGLDKEAADGAAE